MHVLNQGFWYMHCHVEFHNEEGMAMVLQAGYVEEMNAAPKEIHSCGDVMVPEATFLDIYNTLSALHWVKRSSCLFDRIFGWMLYHSLF